MRKMLHVAGVLCLCSSVYAETISGSPYRGFDSSARGGVSTTISNSNSVFNNPATLHSSKYFSELSIDANVSTKENGLIGTIKDLENLKLDDVFNDIEKNSGTNNNRDDMKKTVLDIQNVFKDMNNTSMSLQVGFSVGFRLDNLGIGISNTRTVVGKMIVDQDALQLITKKGDHYWKYDPANDTYTQSNKDDYEKYSLINAFDNGGTYALVQYHSLIEVPVSYSHTLVNKYSDINIGGAIKFMSLDTSSQKSSANADITADTVLNTDSDISFGIDLGATHTWDKYNIGTGLVIKNINTPTFITNGTTYKMDPTIKLGVNKGFFNDDLVIAMDLDVISSKSTFTTEDNQMIGLALAYQPTSWVSLATGIKKNLTSWAKETNNNGAIYSAGLGFGFKWVQLGAGLEMQNDKIEGSDVPKYLSLNLSLVGKFGNSNKRDVPKNNNI